MPRGMAARVTQMVALQRSQLMGEPLRGPYHLMLAAHWAVEVADVFLGSIRHCSTTPEALYWCLWALVRGNWMVGGVSPLLRAATACVRLRRTCPGELVGFSCADSGVGQSSLERVMH